MLRLLAPALCLLVLACGGGKPASATDTPADAAADAAPVPDVPADAAPPACPAQPCAADHWCEPQTHTCQARPTEAEAAQQRAACAFGPGDPAARTLGKEVPVGEQIPIDHFVLVMMENRSFDHYFGAGQQFGLDVDGFPAGVTNPDKSGKAIAPYHEPLGCIDDVHHSWKASHEQFNGGQNDGFVLTNEPDGKRAMGYYDGTDLLFYYGVAKAFGLSDRHHCSLLGPTWVNRMYYVSATSFGRTFNGAPPADVMAQHGEELILAALDAKGIDWRVYATDLTIFYIFGKYITKDGNFERMRPIEEFYADAAAGKLPAVAFVEPTFSMSGAARNDEHPPGTPWQGEQFTHGVLTALMKSPQWPRAAYIQTYDEHGGYFDHVPPPPACKPDGFAPVLKGSDPPGEFDRLGFRVPLLVASPWSKPGYVSHVTTDNTSILRLVEARFGLGALTHRDANAWPMLDFFDFAKPALLEPPQLPAPKDMTEHIEACIQFYP